MKTNKILNNFAKLIDVKSIMTISVTAVFCYLAIVGKISDQQFMTIFAVIVSFFFGTKTGRADAIIESQEDE